MADEQKQMTLDDVLDETPAPEKAPEQAPEKPLSGAEAYQSRKREHRDKELGAQGLVRDPATGQYAKKEETKGAAKDIAIPVFTEQKPEVKAPEAKPEAKPAEEYSVREKAAFAKAADETRKRQAQSQEIARLSKELEDLKKGPQKGFYDDPDGALERQRKELEDKINYATLSTKVQTSESIARSRYQNYDEMFNLFNELVQETPYLAQQAFSSPDPADFAYKTAKRHKELQDAGGVEKMREKMEAELRTKIKAELETELKKRDEELKKDRDALPGSLTDVPSKGSNRPVWGGPPSLEDVLKG